MPEEVLPEDVVVSEEGLVAAEVIPVEVVVPEEVPVAEPAAVAEQVEAALVELVLVSVDLSPEWVEPASGRVRLADVERGNDIDIVMARTDALLVEEALAGTPAPRPRTHDLLLATVGALAGMVTGVTLTERRPDGVYVAILCVLRPDGSTAELDARPSDALNVALRSPGATLRATRALLDQATTDGRSPR